MSYSKDFRLQVLSHIDAGSTIDAVSKLFSIGTTTIKQWKNLRKKTGDVVGPGRPKKAYKIDEEQLKAYVEKHPDAYLEEIAQEFGVTSSGIFVALKRMNITRKKSPRFTESGVK